MGFELNTSQAELTEAIQWRDLGLHSNLATLMQ